MLKVNTGRSVVYSIESTHNANQHALHARPVGEKTQCNFVSVECNQLGGMLAECHDYVFPYVCQVRLLKRHSHDSQLRIDYWLRCHHGGM